jgi:predicted ArsR family transcriptional regulator
VNGHERLVGATRGRILALLRRSEQTVAELAAAVGVSENAVRVHLGGMERDGLVEAAAATRMTGGKPAQIYQLTEVGRELFARAYAGFLASLIGVLESREGPAKARRLLREAGRKASPSEETPGDIGTRVEAAATALRSLGGDVEVERTPNGFRLRGHGCPLGAVVTGEPLACALAEAFVAAIVRAPVTERCERGPVPRCVFEVKSASRS